MMDTHSGPRATVRSTLPHDRRTARDIDAPQERLPAAPD